MLSRGAIRRSTASPPTASSLHSLVGAHGDDDNRGQSRSAYLLDISLGAQLAKLTPRDGEIFDNFGYSVDISGNVAIVGAYGDDDNGPSSGSAYLFDVSSGTQVGKIMPNDGAAVDQFGSSVGISGNTAIVGAYLDDDNGFSSGSAYLFDGTSGSQLAKLTPSDGAFFDWFGYSVDISGSTATVGAYLDDDNGTSSGSAYLFDVISGTQFAKLTPADGAAADWLGFSTGISGNRAIVGAHWNDTNGFSSGSAYLFDVVPEPRALLMGAGAIVASIICRSRQMGFRLRRAALMGGERTGLGPNRGVGCPSIGPANRHPFD